MHKAIKKLVLYTLQKIDLIYGAGLTAQFRNKTGMNLVI